MSATSGDLGFDLGVDSAASREFADRYGEPALGPVCVVIAAYREAATLGSVLDAMPATADGLSLAILVVDDGSDDGTAEVAEAHGAFACRPVVNRGQGAALRLGYRLAAEYGADYVVTTDADGQYDANEISALLAPILGGRADFVSGSRRLGRTYLGDTFRYARGGLLRACCWGCSSASGSPIPPSVCEPCGSRSRLRSTSASPSFRLPSC